MSMGAAVGATALCPMALCAMALCAMALCRGELDALARVTPPVLLLK
jgi:hypothetical protein